MTLFRQINTRVGLDCWLHAPLLKPISTYGELARSYSSGLRLWANRPLGINATFARSRTTLSVDRKNLDMTGSCRSLWKPTQTRPTHGSTNEKLSRISTFRRDGRLWLGIAHRT